MRLFCDMDGVLADFDRGYNEQIGPYGGKEADDVNWLAVGRRKDFFLNLPPMPDFHELWTGIAPYNPTLLTGIPDPSNGLQHAIDNKKAWVHKHIGDHVPVIGCRSREKFMHGQPGDILIDDWEKYRHLWIGMGGTWITHVSAKNTLRMLERHMNGIKP